MRTHESPALFLVPVHVGSDGALGPHQAEDWGLDSESMQLPQRSRRRHAILPVRHLQLLLLWFLVFPEAAGDLETGPSWQLGTERALPLERRGAAMARGVIRVTVLSEHIEGRFLRC